MFTRETFPNFILRANTLFFKVDPEHPTAEPKYIKGTHYFGILSLAHFTYAEVCTETGCVHVEFQNLMQLEQAYKLDPESIVKLEKPKF